MGIKVLSLFDGMSCGQQALNNLGLKDYTYFSSEIDKYAIQVTQENFPNTIQLGNVKEIGRYFGKSLHFNTFCGAYKTEEYVGDIELLLGGSPCQGFSFAGKQLAFDDPRSKLFFEYVRILKEVKPKYFLLENVRMKKEYQDIISEHLFGIEPTLIDSSRLTAQSRKRLYWVGELQEDGTYKQVKIEQPQDRGILLKDILEENVDEKYNLSQKAIESISKYRENYKITGKTPTLTCELAHGWGKNITPGIVKEIEFAEKQKIYIKEATKKGYIEVNPGECFDFTQPNSKTRRGRLMKEKSNCMTAGNFDFMNYDGYRIRKLTPIECERLQGVKDGYTSCVSNSQRYKMLGNGWTVPVIEWILSHILKNLKELNN